MPATAGTLLFLSIAAVTGEPGSLWRAFAAAAAVAATYFVLVSTGMGMGDVKLAPAIGALLGWTSWTTVAQGTFAGFSLAAATATVLIATRKAHGKDHIAFGPFMVAGALLVSAVA